PVTRGVIGVHHGQIVLIDDAFTPQCPYGIGQNTVRFNATGCLVAPGLVDPHTHIVFGGERSHEYAMRANGRSYLEIAQAGGGILSTVKATRAASVDDLIESALPRLDRLLACGVTTAEVKSGYGLSVEAELKMLEVIRTLDGRHPIDLIPTFLGAHTIPPEYRADREAYVRLVIDDMLPRVAQAGLAEFCDVFVEESAFTIEEAERILMAGRAFGLQPKLHADQLTAGEGAELAGRVGAVSADHLEFISPAGIQALLDHQVVAVLLPGASLFLGANEDAPARRMIDAGIQVALATDCNPGTCMTTNLQLMLTLGMSRLKMSPAEVLTAVTHTAAQAIGRGHRSGRLAVGRAADIAVFDVPSHVHLPYYFGVPLTKAVFKAGHLVYSDS
ncbi:MAG: imidazolonepropionase, partial [Myxococcota bacterium]|nr:imidazolonepropionase [Myxococcota bacterium]